MITKFFRNEQGEYCYLIADGKGETLVTSKGYREAEDAIIGLETLTFWVLEEAKKTMMTTIRNASVDFRRGQ